MPINHQPWKASSSNRAVGRGATRPRSAPGNEGPLVVKRGKHVRVWFTLASCDVATRAGPAGGETRCSAAANFCPRARRRRPRARARPVAVALRGARPSSSPPRRSSSLADENEQPSDARDVDARDARGVPRARRRPTRERRPAHTPASRRRVRPVPRDPPRRRRNATAVASSSSSSSSSLAPSPRVSTRRRPPRDRSPRADDASPPLPRADAPARAPLGRTRARTRRPGRAHRPRTKGDPSRARPTRRRTQGGTHRPRTSHPRSPARPRSRI